MCGSMHLHVGLCAWVPVPAEGRVDRCPGAGVTDSTVEDGSLGRIARPLNSWATSLVS